MTQNGSGKKKSAVGELFRDLLIAALIALAVSFFIRPTIVYETSMQPTIDPGNYIIMSKQAYRSGKVKRGDVVIFKSDIYNEETGNKLMMFHLEDATAVDIPMMGAGEDLLK